MFKDRVQKARNAVGFAKVLSTNQAGKVKTTIVPGSESKQYHVILRRHEGIWSGECRLNIGPVGFVPCKGNANGYACYHCMTAVRKVQFTNSEPKARKLENLGMKAFRLQPWNNGRSRGETVWVLVK